MCDMKRVVERKGNKNCRHLFVEKELESQDGIVFVTFKCGRENCDREEYQIVGEINFPNWENAPYADMEKFESMI